MSFSECLRDLRKDKKCTQRELAVAIGYSTNIICEWENQRCEPNIETILKIADFFGVSVDYLLGRTDELGVILPNPSPTVPALESDARQLLEMFERMNHQQKIKVIAYSEGLLSTSGNSSASRRS